MAPPVEKTFNVGVDGQQFEDYIRALRQDLRDPENQGVQLTEENQGVQLPEDTQYLRQLRPTTRGEPRQWLHLTMVANNNAEITVWIRTDNLYVVGFENNDPAGAGRRRSYEFRPIPNSNNDANKKNDKEKNAKKKKQRQEDQEHLIPGSTFLTFGGGYDHLGQLEWLQDTTSGSRQQAFGPHQLQSAIAGLAAYTPGTRGADDVRYWLRTIIVTISESLRFNNVCQFMDELLRNHTSAWLTEHMIKCIHNWSAMSQCVIANAQAQANAIANAEADPYGPLRQNGICENNDEACRLLGILNSGPAKDDKDKPGRSQGRPRREAAGDGDVAPQLGLTFVEIFSAVVVPATTSNRNLMLYGHIAIEDGLGWGSSQPLLMRGRSNALPLSAAADSLIQLTGPARAVWGYDEIVMRVDIMDAVPGAADMTPDTDELGSGKLVWNTYDTPRMVYDEVEEYVFEGVSGVVNVRCAVITNAVMANVVLRHTGRWDQKEVYGTISASTSMFGPQDKVMLFDREWKDAISVRYDEDVPLLRDFAIVPLRSTLTIYADLWTRANITDMSADHRISSGVVAELQYCPFGGIQKVISGSDFELWVTWSLN